MTQLFPQGSFHNLCLRLNRGDDHQHPSQPAVQGRQGQHHRQPLPGHGRDRLHRLVHPRVLHQAGWGPAEVGLPQGRDERGGRVSDHALLRVPLLWQRQ